MTTLVEGDLEFEFDATWTAVQWDRSAFRALRGHLGKAADIVGMRARTSGSSALFVFEIKDYPMNPGSPVPSPTDLAETCATKVRDTLAQIVFSPQLVGRPTGAMERLCRGFGSTRHPLHVVVWVEDANLPPLDVTLLQAELRRALQWLPTKSVSTFSLSTPPYPPGLSVTRTR